MLTMQVHRFLLQNLKNSYQSLISLKIAHDEISIAPRLYAHSSTPIFFKLSHYLGRGYLAKFLVRRDSVMAPVGSGNSEPVIPEILSRSVLAGKISPGSRWQVRPEGPSR